MQSPFIRVAAIALVAAGCRSERVLGPDPVFITFPRNPLLQEGMVLQMKALAPSDGPPLTQPVKWTSSNAGVATVDADGLVTSLSPGTTVITATSGDVADTTTVEVEAREGVSLTASGDTNCGLTTSAGAVCWGENLYGQTGTRSPSQIVFVPTPVAAGVQWRLLDASWNHACGVDTNFDVYCWGLNNFGQLGMGTESAPVIPSSKVVSDKKFVQVSAGGASWPPPPAWPPAGAIEAYTAQTTCALTREGEAYCWGRQGSPVNADDVHFSTPQPIAPGIRLAFISVGNGYGCAISIDRRAYCWGNNDFGQLGRAQTQFDRAVRPVEGDIRFTRISAGGIHACAISVDQRAYCWGANEALQLGTSTSVKCSFLALQVDCQTHPVEVSGGYRFKSISPGSWGVAQSVGSAFQGYISHTCGLTIDRDIVCWGSNSSNRIRKIINFNESLKLAPVMLSFPDNKFKAVVAGASHTCAVLVTGQAWCWGAEGRGQLGIPQGTSLGGSVGAVAGTFVFQ